MFEILEKRYFSENLGVDNILIYYIYLSKLRIVFRMRGLCIAFKFKIII